MLDDNKIIFKITFLGLKMLIFYNIYARLLLMLLHIVTKDVNNGF